MVEAIGSEAQGFEVGDAVYAMPGMRVGGYAEYVTVPASAVAAKPRSLDHVQAASVPLAALTAWQALFDKAALSNGQTVLIHAASGGVGSFAVQFAKIKHMLSAQLQLITRNSWKRWVLISLWTTGQLSSRM